MSNEEIKDEIYTRGVKRFDVAFGTNYSQEDEVDEELTNVLSEFEEYLIKHSKDLDPEFAKIINDNFWDLI